MNWSSDPDSRYTLYKPKEFLKFSSDNGFVQVIDFLTRGNAFYGLAANRQEYCFTKVFFFFFLRTGGGPPGVLFYKRFFIFKKNFF